MCADCIWKSWYALLFGTGYASFFVLFPKMQYLTVIAVKIKTAFNFF